MNTDQHEKELELFQLYKQGVVKGLLSSTKCVESSIEAIHDVISENDTKSNRYITLNQSYNLTLAVLNELLDSINNFKDELLVDTDRRDLYSDGEFNSKEVN